MAQCCHLSYLAETGKRQIQSPPGPQGSSPRPNQLGVRGKGVLSSWSGLVYIMKAGKGKKGGNEEGERKEKESWGEALGYIHHSQQPQKHFLELTLFFAIFPQKCQDTNTGKVLHGAVCAFLAGTDPWIWPPSSHTTRCDGTHLLSQFTSSWSSWAIQQNRKLEAASLGYQGPCLKREKQIRTWEGDQGEREREGTRKRTHAMLRSAWRCEDPKM